MMVRRMVIFCGNCGNKLDENYHFCPKCGTKIKSAQDGLRVDSNQRKKIDSLSLILLIILIIIALAKTFLAIIISTAPFFGVQRDFDIEALITVVIASWPMLINVIFYYLYLKNRKWYFKISLFLISSYR